MAEKNYTISEFGYVIPISEILADKVDPPKFLELCKACENYGNRWCCPPRNEDSLAFWAQYDEFLLIARMLRPMPGMTEQEAIAAIEKERAQFSDDLLNRETKDSYALAAGPCTRCGDVCMRALGGLCNFPEKVRYSIASLGGDVGKMTERYLGKSLEWIQNGVLPEYFMLVGGVLKKSSTTALQCKSHFW